MVVFGGLTIGMAYVASQLGGVLQAALSISGIVGGPIVGVFTLAILFPFANSYVSAFNVMLFTLYNSSLLCDSMLTIKNNF